MMRSHRFGWMLWVPCVLGLSALLMAGCSAGGAGGGGGGGGGDDQIDNVNGGDDQADLVAREIEEADIVKYDNGYLYVANRYRGLRIIDVRAIERPVLVGGADASGRAVELYVYQQHVFLITSADYSYCAGEPVGFDDTALSDSLVSPGYNGSRLWVFDVSDPANPAFVRLFPMNGYVTATRRVGDVLYVAANELETVEDTGTNGLPEDATTNGGLPDVVLADSAFVESINIADPSHPEAVDFVRIDGEALEMQVSTSAVYVAGADPDMADTTRITYVDISDPDGDIEVRDTFRVPGLLRSRFYMDEYGDTLRVITQEQLLIPGTWLSESVSLYTYDLSDPDNIDRLAHLNIQTNEEAWAVRFDGPRGYVVTFQQIDPLYVLDLSDPVNPIVAGQLEVPGYSTHIVPLGDRLVAIGYDGSAQLRPAVSLYDVSNPERPEMLSRVSIGERNDYGVYSEATFDEKALKVLEDEELILVPFSFLDEETLEWVDSVQIIDLGATSLQERGVAEHRGLVRRADVLDDRLWVLSDEALGVFDIDDPDEPVAMSRLDFITEQELLDAGLSDCVDSARFRENPTGFFGPMDGMVYYPVPCGAMGAPALAMLLAGLTALRMVRRHTV